MNDALRALVILCAGLTAWIVTSDYRLGLLAYIALVGIAPWKDDS